MVTSSIIVVVYKWVNGIDGYLSPTDSVYEAGTLAKRILDLPRCDAHVVRKDTFKKETIHWGENQRLNL